MHEPSPPGFWLESESATRGLDRWAADSVPTKLRHRILLRRLDLAAPLPIGVIAYERPAPNGRASRPHLFVAADGLHYWIKAKAQHGLFAEYAAGQLASSIGAGPANRILNVPRSALPEDGALYYFEGLRVGSVDVPRTINLDEFREILTAGRELTPQIDPASRALSIVFQTWINATDEQVLVGLDDGKVYSVDHGDCFASLSPGPPSRIVVASIPGISDDMGREWVYVESAVNAIEQLTEDVVFAAVGGVPDLPGWQALFERRLQVARWLIKRQLGLRDQVRRWAWRLS